jgi:hypothetical protein
VFLYWPGCAGHPAYQPHGREHVARIYSGRNGKAWDDPLGFRSSCPRLKRWSCSEGDLKAQLNQAWENVRLALAGSGATFQDVVKVTTYVVNYKPSMRNDIREARQRFMGTGEPPAATLVGVQALASDDWLVEIEVTAVIR